VLRNTRQKRSSKVGVDLQKLTSGFCANREQDCFYPAFWKPDYGADLDAWGKNHERFFYDLRRKSSRRWFDLNLSVSGLYQELNPEAETFDRFYSGEEWSWRISMMGSIQGEWPINVYHHLSEIKNWSQDLSFLTESQSWVWVSNFWSSFIRRIRASSGEVFGSSGNCSVRFIQSKFFCYFGFGFTPGCCIGSCSVFWISFPAREKQHYFIGFNAFHWNLRKGWLNTTSLNLEQRFIGMWSGIIRGIMRRPGWFFED